MDSSSPILQIEVETRLSGASGWTKGDIKIDSNNKTITGFTQQGASIGPIEFDSYMGPDAIKNCRKPSKFGMFKKSFDRKNRYDFIKEGKVVLSINFYFATGKEESFRRMLSNFTEVSACLAGGRKRKSRKAKKTRKRKNTRRKTRKNKRNKRGRGPFSFLKKKPKSEQTNVEMSSVDPRELPRTLKEAYNSRDRYASDTNLQMKYPDGLSNSAMDINKLEQQVREKHGDDKLKQIKQEYKESVCSNEHGTYTNYGVVDCGSQSGGKRRRKRKTRKAKKSRKSKKSRKAKKGRKARKHRKR